MNNEIYGKRIVSGDYKSYTMDSGNTLYVEEYIPGDETAYTLAQPDGHGLTWNKAESKDEPWVDSIISNAVNQDADLKRLAQLLGTFGVEAHWCNEVEVEDSIKEATITVVRPIPQDGDDNKLPARFHIIKESPLGLTWVNTYTWSDRVRATDRDAAMKLIEDMERAEQN